jgi:hypothetical protein
MCRCGFTGYLGVRDASPEEATREEGTVIGNAVGTTLSVEPAEAPFRRSLLQVIREGEPAGVTLPEVE